MTLSKIYPKSGPFEGGVLVYPFTFEVGSADEVVVYEGNEVSNNVQSILIHEDGIGGEITLKEISDKRVTIVRKSDFSQEIDFQNNTAFLPEVFEQGLDHTVKLAQELKVGVDRAVKVPLDSDETPEEMAQSLLNAVDDAKRYAAASADSANSAATSAESVGTKAQEAQEAARVASEGANYVAQEIENLEATFAESAGKYMVQIDMKAENALANINNAEKQALKLMDEKLGTLSADLDGVLEEL